MTTSLASVLQARTNDAKVARYFPDDRLSQLFKALDNEKEWLGAGVVFVPDLVGQIERSIAESKYAQLANRKSKIVEITLRSSCRADGRILFIREILPKPEIRNEKLIERERSSLGKELVKTGWSCTGAAIGWVLIIGEMGAGAVTVGATWTAVPLTLAATSASTFQCGTAIGRSANAAMGNEHYNDTLDDSKAYNALMTGLDVIQIIDVTKTLQKQTVLYKVLNSKKISTGGFLQVVKGLTRAERKRLAEEMLKLDYPELAASKKLLKQVMNGSRLLDDGSVAAKVYTQQQVQKLVNTKVVELVGAAITTKGSLPGATGLAEQAVGFALGIGHRK